MLALATERALYECSCNYSLRPPIVIGHHCLKNTLSRFTVDAWEGGEVILCNLIFEGRTMFTFMFPSPPQHKSERILNKKVSGVNGAVCDLNDCRSVHRGLSLPPSFYLTPLCVKVKTSDGQLLSKLLSQSQLMK